MNHFLRSHRVVSVQREFSNEGYSSSWHFCVEYLDLQSPPDSFISRKTDRIDYKDILSESDFNAFNRLRDLRKELAHQEGIAVYAICTNEQLSAMVQKRCRLIADLKKIPGFGEAKAAKYGQAILDVLQSVFKDKNYEASGSVDGKDNGAGQPASGVAKSD